MSRIRPTPEEVQQDRAVRAFLLQAEEYLSPALVACVLDTYPVKNLYGSDKEARLPLMLEVQT